MARRALLRASIVLVTLFLLIWAAGNVFLMTPLLRRILSSDPESLVVSYDQAFMPWPGRVVARNLRLRTRDSNVEFQIVLREVRLDVSLVELLSRRFHVRRLEGSGLSFRLRERLLDSEVALAALHPPIEGYPSPAMRARVETPSRPSPKAFRLVFSSIAIEELHELWIDSLRFSGSGRVAGAFMLVSGTEAEVSPSTLTFESGIVATGGDVLFSTFTGVVSARIPRWSSPEFPGNAVLGLVDGDLCLNAAITRTAALSALFERAGGPPLANGSASVSLDARFEKGKGNGRFGAEARNVLVKLAASPFRFSLSAHGPLPEIALEHQRFTNARGRLTLDGRANTPDAPPFRAVAAVLGDADLKTASLSGSFGGWASDARPIVSLTGLSLPFFAKGILKLDEPLTTRFHIAVSPGLLGISRLDAKGGGFRLSGELSMKSPPGRKAGGPTRFALLLENRLKDLGLDGTGAGEPKIRVFGVHRWFENRDVLSKPVVRVSTAQRGTRIAMSRP
ncbi:MAG: hypothetical protein JNK60_06775 [Acidobacteria bacterium]|nr:hypothetical protein [Acidobacteriota bacterium]